MVLVSWNKGSTWIEFLKFCFNVCVSMWFGGGGEESSVLFI